MGQEVWLAIQPKKRKKYDWLSNKHLQPHLLFGCYKISLFCILVVGEGYFGHEKYLDSIKLRPYPLFFKGPALIFFIKKSFNV